MNTPEDGVRQLAAIEFEALRTEILTIQRRSLQTIAAGALGVPFLSYLSIPKEATPALEALNAIKVALPFAVAVIVMFYLGDNEAILRCGRYIRERIEDKFSAARGWEQWLESGRPSTRITEGYVAGAVSLLFGVYYFGAWWFAGSYIREWPPLFAWIAHFIYAVLAAVLAIQITKRLRRMSTSAPMTETDQHDLDVKLKLLARARRTAQDVDIRRCLAEAAVALHLEFHRGAGHDIENGRGLTREDRTKFHEFQLID